MVEIHKVLLNQIFDEKIKMAALRKPIYNNQVYMRGNLEFVIFCQRIFDDKKN